MILFFLPFMDYSYLLIMIAMFANVWKGVQSIVNAFLIVATKKKSDLLNQ